MFKYKPRFICIEREHSLAGQTDCFRAVDLTELHIPNATHRACLVPFNRLDWFVADTRHWNETAWERGERFICQVDPRDWFMWLELHEWDDSYESIDYSEYAADSDELTGKTGGARARFEKLYRS